MTRGLVAGAVAVLLLAPPLWAADPLPRVKPEQVGLD